MVRTVSIVVLVAVAVLGGLAGSARAQAVSAVRASDWDALFDRTSGWTGADGIYSIPLSGRDAQGSVGPLDQTLFVFNDTFIGNVSSTGARLAGSTLVNNTLAVLRGGKPDPSAIQFYWRTVAGQPEAEFVPTTPSTVSGQWYWPMDGIATQGKLYLFAMRMQRGTGGAFDFAVAGVSLIKLDLHSPDPIGTQVQIETPLHVVPTDGRGELIFGAGIMANTVEAGALAPDGYVYVYGTQNDPLNKKLIVARVQPDRIEDFTQWQFWTGTTWSSRPDAAAPLTDRVSSELSMTQLSDGRFVLVFQKDTLSADTAIRTAAGPLGPFSPLVVVWHCPEAAAYPQAYCYNAKAHPHLSAPGELLVSYNVNTFSFAANLANADIYRPRFLRLRQTR